MTREKFNEAIACLDQLRGDESEKFSAILALERSDIIVTEEFAPSAPGRDGLWILDGGSRYSKEVDSWKVTDQITEEMNFECGIRNRDMNCVEWERLQGTPSWKRVESEVLKEQIAIKLADELEIDWESI